MWTAQMPTDGPHSVAVHVPSIILRNFAMAIACAVTKALFICCFPRTRYGMSLCALQRYSTAVPYRTPVYPSAILYYGVRGYTAMRYDLEYDKGTCVQLAPCCRHTAPLLPALWTDLTAVQLRTIASLLDFITFTRRHEWVLS